MKWWLIFDPHGDWTEDPPVSFNNYKDAVDEAQNVLCTSNRPKRTRKGEYLLNDKSNELGGEDEVRHLREVLIFREDVMKILWPDFELCPECGNVLEVDDRCINWNDNCPKAMYEGNKDHLND